MIADMLKKMRENRKLTQQDVADGINVNSSTYKNYEYGRREPDLETVSKLADFYNVSVDYLLGRSKTQNNLFEAYNLDDDELRFFTGFLNSNHHVRKLVIQTFKPLFEQFKFTIKDSDGHEKEIQFNNLFNF